jgi:hypothetical protein
LGAGRKDEGHDHQESHNTQEHFLFLHSLFSLWVQK